MSDMVNHPQHYGGDVPYEVIKVLEAWLGPDGFKAWLSGIIVKYIPRAGKKADELEDWKKVVWYSNYMVKLLEDRRDGKERPGDPPKKTPSIILNTSCHLTFDEGPPPRKPVSFIHSFNKTTGKCVHCGLNAADYTLLGDKAPNCVQRRPKNETA